MPRLVPLLGELATAFLRQGTYERLSRLARALRLHQGIVPEVLVGHALDLLLGT